MTNRLFRAIPLPAALLAAGLCPVPPAWGEAVEFTFSNAPEFSFLNASAMPADMVRDGVALTVHSIAAPAFPGDYLAMDIQPALRLNVSSDVGLGVDNGRINNDDFAQLYGDDARAESRALNFLESITLSFDHSIILSGIVVADLEQHEKVTLEVEGGPTVEIAGTRPWSKGNSGPAVLEGANLGLLDGLLIERKSRITITFDTVDPLDRVPDGTGSNLTASPSAGLLGISATFPDAFGLGNPYVIQGGPDQAEVGCELWEEDAMVTVRWTRDPDQGWTFSQELGTQSPKQVQGAVLTGLVPNTTWHFQFVADNGSQVVESPIQQFKWYEEIFVSPDGDDANSGFSASEPLATIAEALDRIRAMGRRPQPEGPAIPNFYGSPADTHGGEILAHLDNLVDLVTVVLLPGYHYLEDTIVIDKSIDGNIHFVGQWAAGAGEELRARLNRHGDDPDWMDPPASHMPVVSGAAAITGWETTTVNGIEAWVAEIPGVASGDWYFHQLFVDGRRAERSRWPKRGWYRVEEGDNDTRLDFRVKERDLRDIDIASWSNLQDVQVVLLHRWVESRIRVGSFDPVTRWINLLPPAPDPAFTFVASAPVHGAGLVPYFFDNVFETLSEPGEWYLDRISGRLYYVPLPGQTIENTRVHAPRLTELFKVVGREAGDSATNERIWNVGFRGLAFCHTRVDDFAIHMGTGNNPYNSGRGALHFRYARAPHVEACLFGHVGELGVEFAEETTGGLLSSSIFRSMGFGAFKMWQSNSVANLEQRSGWTRIHDNDIRGYGRYWQGGVALNVTESVFTTIEHNHVRDGFYNAIRAAGGNVLLRFGFSNLVRKNRAHDAGKGVLSDLAGLYVPGKSPYSVVEGNVVHDINGRDYTSPACYLDGAAEYWTVRHNWLHGSNELIINMKGWTHNIHNNVLAFAGDQLVNRRNGDIPSHESTEFPILDRMPPDFTRNLFVQNGGGYVYEYGSYTDIIQPWGTSDHNLFWDQTAQPWVGGVGQELGAFQTSANADLNSLVLDPLFVDARRGDFRLHPGSPAVASLGFVPVDNRDAGLRQAVWEQAGAVWYRDPPEAGPDWLPGDVPGLQAWLDAADLLETDALDQWDTKTPYTFMMRQFDTGYQPAVVGNARNGLPVVRFTGREWMGTHEHSWRMRRNSGRFHDREFVIFAVSSSMGDDNVLLAKGNEGADGQWTIGQQANAFRWNGDQYVGSSGTGFAVRSWRRGPASWQYHENGILAAESSASLGHLFNNEDALLLGSSSGGGYLTGDVGEILIYQGHVSDADIALIHDYLMDKWLQPDEIRIFTADTVVESTAARGIPYLRSLSVHIGAGFDPRTLTFSKVSGPEWLTVAADGTLGGVPDSLDAGPDTFTVRAVTAEGGQHTITLEVEVVAADAQPPEPPAAIQVGMHGDMISLEWEPSVEPDFSHYRVLRAATLDPGDFETVASPLWHPYHEEEWTGSGARFYKVQSVDTSGN